MRNRAEPLAPLGADLEDARHEPPESGAATRQLEVAISRLDRRDRRERAEGVAVLDVAIQAIAHLARARCREDAAVAQSARTELGRAVHPADHAAVVQRVGRPLDDRRVVELLDGLAVLARGPGEFVCVDRRSQNG